MKAVFAVFVFIASFVFFILTSGDFIIDVLLTDAYSPTYTTELSVLGEPIKGVEASLNTYPKKSPRHAVIAVFIPNSLTNTYHVEYSVVEKNLVVHFYTSSKENLHTAMFALPTKVEGTIYFEKKSYGSFNPTKELAHEKQEFKKQYEFKTHPDADMIMLFIVIAISTVLAVLSLFGD